MILKAGSLHDDKIQSLSAIDIEKHLKTIIFLVLRFLVIYNV